MEREYKNIRGEVKQLENPGEGLAIISTFNVIDSDGDVVVPGAFGEQTVQMIPTHNWNEAPIGKAKIKEQGEAAVAEFKLNLEMINGKEWYSALKFDMDNPPAKQEYSYGFSVVKERRGDFEGRQVRFLEQLKVHEISPVLVGAGVGTTTLALKQEKKTTLEEDIKAVKEQLGKVIERVQKIKEIREGQERPLSKDRVKELIDIQESLLELDKLIKSPYGDPSGVIAEFHEIQKRMIDFRKNLL